MIRCTINSSPAIPDGMVVMAAYLYRCRMEILSGLSRIVSLEKCGQTGPVSTMYLLGMQGSSSWAGLLLLQVTYSSIPIGQNGKAVTWVTVPGATNGDEKLYWGGPAQVLGNEVQMVMGQLHLINNVLVHQSTDVAVFTLPDMQQKEIIQQKYIGELPFDASLFKANDGYTYMYTSKAFGICASHVFVTRAAGNDITGQWGILYKEWLDNHPACSRMIS